MKTGIAYFLSILSIILIIGLTDLFLKGIIPLLLSFLLAGWVAENIFFKMTGKYSKLFTSKKKLKRLQEKQKETEAVVV